MSIKVLRILEYTYESIDDYASDSARWFVQGTVVGSVYSGRGEPKRGKVRIRTVHLIDVDEKGVNCSGPKEEGPAFKLEYPKDEPDEPEAPEKCRELQSGPLTGILLRMRQLNDNNGTDFPAGHYFCVSHDLPDFPDDSFAKWMVVSPGLYARAIQISGGKLRAPGLIVNGMYCRVNNCLSQATVSRI